MLEQDKHIADFHDWTIYAPNGGSGVVFTLFNIIIGGHPIFKHLRGYDIRELPPDYHAELSGTTNCEDGLKRGCASWKDFHDNN